MSSLRKHVATPLGALAVTVLEPATRDPVAGEYVVFLHPTNLDSRCWQPVAERMRDHWRVLIDSRGHGASHQRGPFFIADYAADVQHVIDALVPGRAHLVGGSLGGSIACAVAGKLHDKIASICAVGGALEPADPAVVAGIDEAFRSGTALDEIFGAVMAREVDAGLAPEVAAQALLQVGIHHRARELIREITLNAFSEDGRVHARDVDCPVTVLNGEYDESCSPDAGRRMADSLGGRFELLPRMGHLAMLQAPDVITTRLVAALASIH